MKDYFTTLKIIVFGICFVWSTSVWATEIYLKNGDKITGVIVKEDGASLVVQTMEAGRIKLDKSFIDLPKTYPENYQPASIQPPVKPVEWKKTLSLGYTQTGGNTRKQLGQLTTLINRKTPRDETTLRFDALYSSSNEKVDGKKFYGMARYAYSYGNQLKWYNFSKIEGDADRFEDIDYRLTPSVGTGYWFSDTDDWKAMTELGIGYQYTNYRTEIKSSGETVLVPRFFVDKRLIGKLHLSEDLTFYPSLANINDYRFRSETDLVNQITQRWALKISFTDDFNSNPPMAIKKNDYTWLTSLDYSF